VQPPWALPKRLQCSGRMVQEKVVVPWGLALAETSLSWEERIEAAQPWRMLIWTYDMPWKIIIYDKSKNRQFLTLKSGNMQRKQNYNI